MSTTETLSPPLDPSPVVDAELALRLERLAARRAQNASSPTPSSAKKTPTGAPRKRRHPAQKSRIAALILSLATTGGLTAAFAAFDGPANSVVTAAGGVVATSTAPPDTAASTAAPSDTAASTAGSTQTAASTTTIVNGNIHTNKWGPVQVQATFGSDGSIVAVDALQTPFVDRKSVQINDRAVPTLNSEVLTSQSANVDSVSGATYTSIDYEQSLQSAIDAARSAGITQLI